MNDDLGRDFLLIISTLMFIIFALGIGGDQEENNDEENDNDRSEHKGSFLQSLFEKGV